MKYAITIGLASLSVSLANTIWGVGITGWIPKKTLLHHSKKLGRDILIWTKHDLENKALKLSIDNQYGKELTVTNMLFGSFRMIMFFCSKIQMDAVTNLMLANAETIKQEMTCLEKKINNKEYDIDNITLTDFLAGNGAWAHFQLIKLAVNDNNDAMDALMKYKHINNLMLFVYMAMNAFDGDFPLTYIIHLAYNILEVSYTYRIASQASSLVSS